MNQPTHPPLPTSPWTMAEAELYALLDCNARGLAGAEAELRLSSYGPNRLQVSTRRSLWSILGAQFKSLMVAFLLVAAVLSFALGDRLEAAAVMVVVVVNTLIGFTTELRATRSMEALRRMGSATVRVWRDGRVVEVVAEQLVPGDVVVLEGGDVVGADLRVIKASKLQVDESTLTGESLPISKAVGWAAATTELAERRNMLYRGTAVTRGSALGLVVATGRQTELGRIAELVAQTEKDELTPLEQRLDRMGRRLIWLTLVIAALVAVSGMAVGKSMWLMLQTGIALAVATIPEGLPVVATLALARGMWRMARRNALIKKLSAVETLGATSVICTDKTGTLTENRMTVVEYALADSEVRVAAGPEAGFYIDTRRVLPGDLHTLNEALRIGALCTNASLSDGRSSGDPLEVALLVAAAKAGMVQPALRESWPELREEAFDPVAKMMATYHRGQGSIYVAVKGAPEAVLQHCTAQLHGKGEVVAMDAALRAAWLQRNGAMAAAGLRVLGLARKEVGSEAVAPYQGLTFVGLIGMQDPPRPAVREAIAACKRAGIGVVMVTGDQEQTARSVARAVGLAATADAPVIHGRELSHLDLADPATRERLLACTIYCRVSPADKLTLIALHQGAGSVVAMTGDGVNDAPALKKADIGVAMGLRGTQVAREASDMVLKDDAFASITAAVEQGRIIFNNIRRFVVYLLSCNLSEVMVVGLAALVNAPLPLLPLQILFLNLVTDVFPALALGLGEGDPEVMRRPPRPRSEAIITTHLWWEIVFYGTIMTVSVLTQFFLALEVWHWPESVAVTMAFMTLAFAQLWHVFNMRDAGGGWQSDVLRNRYVWAALLLCTALLLSYLWWPLLAEVLSLQRLDALQWSMVAGFSCVPLLLGQGYLAWHGRVRSDRGA